jgi:hypothetical protein
MKIMTIDPGTPFGWAVWHNVDDRHHYGWFKPTYFGVEKQILSTWSHRVTCAGEQLRSLITARQPNRIYCERPRYFQGHAAAARGSFEKLCMVVGYFMAVIQCHGYELQFVEVAEWMGQMNAEAIRHRAGRILGEDYVAPINEHALDAICIGLHVLGRWPHDGRIEVAEATENFGEKSED